MTDNRVDLDDDEPRGIWARIELFAAILLGLAGILTAYAAFQGALADGDALDKYTESAKATADANGYFSDGRAQQNQDANLFGQYITLTVGGQEETAEILRERLFSSELEAATQEWLELPEEETPPTPLDLESYVVPDIGLEDGCVTEEEECYASKFAESEVAFAEAQKANEDGDRFELASVFLAVALFLAGIASLFRQRPIQMAMLIGSVVLILPGLYAIGQGKGWV